MSSKKSRRIKSIKIARPIEYTPELIANIREWVADCETISEVYSYIESALGLTRDHIRRLNRKYGFWLPYDHKKNTKNSQGLETTFEETNLDDDTVYSESGKIVAPATQEKTELPPEKSQAKAFFNKEDGVAESVDSNVRTLEQLLTVCKVDLETWEVEKYVVNKWDCNAGGGDIQPLYQVKAWLKRKRGSEECQKFLSIFKEKAAKFAPKSFVFKPAQKGADCIYILNIHDLHLSKLAYRKETGESDWDIRLAEKAFNDAIEDLMGKAPKERIEKVVVIVGSDMLQIDNDKSQTTAGTYVDSDSRLSKAYDVCTKMLSENIEKIAQRFNVHVVTFPGNHDSTVSLYLGYYLSAWFRNHPNVLIDKDPKSRKYISYGANLIGFDHGDEAKMANLPLIMMRENQTSVSQFKYFEMLCGHLHRDSSSEFQGVKVRIAPALCPADKWHARKGFLGNIRTSQGLLYQKENGIEAIYYSKPLD
jgi:hypothetical protein